MLAQGSSIWELSLDHLAIRMVLAAVLGGLIGIEREWHNHAAGFRTHILVCLGSATIMLMSLYGFSAFVGEPNVQVDPARLAAQVISGIGFLGAGAILRNGDMIKGLTTAASIWTVAAIGLCVGAGYYSAALLCTFLVLVSLYMLNKWEKRLLRNRRICSLEIRIANGTASVGSITAALSERSLPISRLKLESSRKAGGPDEAAREYKLEIKLKGVRQEALLEAVESIGRMEDVTKIEALGLGAVMAAAAK
ncbi:MgtC/SapB family protein [Cohnella fermenti]|uniref:MgtC/SapB family protein n=1 Tax=Cohnella fermenti TaxID=2565925 RepID=A0A4S4BK54_9BACL|nr:MgtC/SapB family protein [Cohnella fermenti]THF74508.1 MgtC/SapB family protein [Cohnella fermenti]